MSSSLPSPELWQKIQDLEKEKMKTEGYLIATGWWNKFKKFNTENLDKLKEIGEEPGEIDNHCLL